MMKRILLVTTLLAWFIAPCSSFAASKQEEKAKELYERGMKVYEVDVLASVGLLTQAAKMGHVDSMVRLGHTFQTGPKPSLKSALSWYKKAVEAGNTAVIYEIGSIYEHGDRKLKPDIAEAIVWYEKGVEANSLKCATALAHIYASCEDPEFHDQSKAVFLATALVKKDSRNPDYLDLLAAALARSLDFPNALKISSQAIACSSLEEAAERRERKEQYEMGMPYPAVATEVWILEAATQKNPWAVMQLADEFGDPLSNEYNPDQAREWYEIAAQNGNSDALLELGLMCFKGEGGDVNMKKAFWCFSESAEAGNTLAYKPLARMYFGGKGVGQDVENALEWYEKAADSSGRNVSQEKFIKWFLKQKVRPSPEELYATAFILIEDQLPSNNGQPKTLSNKTFEVRQYFWLAAEQDHLKAMKELADMYFYGKRYFVREGEIDKTTGGVECNYTRALDYYQQLDRRGIQCHELEPCRELALEELKEQRERQRKKQ